MNLNNYSIKKLDDIYLEDIPYILKPSWAVEYINASKNALPSCFAVCSHTGVSDIKRDIESGQAVLVRNRYSGTEIFSVIGFDGQPSNDLPLFLRERLRRVIEGQRKKNYKDNASAYADVQARNAKKPIEVPSFSIEDALANPERQGISSVPILPIEHTLAVAADAIDTGVRAGKLSTSTVANIAAEVLSKKLKVDT